MHIIQIHTIGAWKGAREWSGKPCSCYIVKSHGFYKEWAKVSRKCVAIVNHKRVVYWFFNSGKMEHMLEKHDDWHGAMVWPHCALVKRWECLIYVVMHALHKPSPRKFHDFWGGNHQNWRGIQISVLVCHLVFFNNQHTPPMQHVQIWHISRIIHHI